MVQVFRQHYIRCPRRTFLSQSSSSPHVTDAGWKRQGVLGGLRTVLQGCMERLGKGKNNEASEDKTELPSTSTPCPAPFSLTARSGGTRTRRVSHRPAWPSARATRPAASPHAAATAALAVAVFQFLFCYVFECYSSRNSWFRYTLFIRS